MNKEEFIKSIGGDDAILREKIERLDFLYNLASRTAIHAYEYLDELDIFPTAEEYLTYVEDYLFPAILKSAREIVEQGANDMFAQTEYSDVQCDGECEPSVCVFSCDNDSSSDGEDNEVEITDDLIDEIISIIDDTDGEVAGDES